MKTSNECVKVKSRANPDGKVESRRSLVVTLNSHVQFSLWDHCDLSQCSCLKNYLYFIACKYIAKAYQDSNDLPVSETVHSDVESTDALVFAAK